MWPYTYTDVSRAGHVTNPSLFWSSAVYDVICGVYINLVVDSSARSLHDFPFAAPEVR